MVFVKWRRKKNKTRCLSSNKRILLQRKHIEGAQMTNYLKQSLFLFLILLGLISNAQAECIVTTKDFTKSSRILYVNPTNGSDQLAKNYNYNLGSVRNPYQPRRIVAFQSVEEALKARNEAAGDLVLIKAGPNWANYDLWSKNQLAQFNDKSAQVTSYSQRQCRGEDLTWVPSAVTDTHSADTAPVTEFSNNNDISVANTELVTPSNPVINQTPSSTSLSTSPTSSPRKSSGGSSSGGASSGASAPTNALDNITDLQPPGTTRASRNQLQNTVAESSDIVAGLPPAIVDETEIDSDVPSIDNGQDKIDTVYTPECTVNAPWQNAIQTYPKDSDGWSIIKPDIETKIVYVSSSEGDDSSGQPYNGVGMVDPFNPSEVKPYKTIEKAYAQIRDGKPDWILLKKGDKFELEKTLWLKTGKSQTAHIVIGAYGGKNDKRPIVDSKSNNTIQGLKNRSYNTIIGIEFYASIYDPSSPNFIGWGSKGKTAFTNLASNVGGDRYVRGLHIENNRFNYYSGAIVLGSMGPALSTNIVIRRNEILNSYSSTSHSQGMFLSQVDHILIEENIFDHNGWFQQRPLNVAMNSKENGYATMFNHNVYIENSHNMVIRKNISSRASSIGMKFTSNANSETKINTIESSNVLLIDNLFIDGEIGISLGGNTDFNNGYRWDNIQVINNVLSNLGRSRPTNRNISWGIGAYDWKSGNICGNFILDKSNKEITNVYAIDVSGDVGNVSVHSNTIVNIGLMNESYQSASNHKLLNSNNIYINKTETNYLDEYTSGISYENYIKNNLIDLRNNPYKRYFDVSDAIEYLKSRATNERNSFLIKN